MAGPLSPLYPNVQVPAIPPGIAEGLRVGMQSLKSTPAGYWNNEDASTRFFAGDKDFHLNLRSVRISYIRTLHLLPAFYNRWNYFPYNPYLSDSTDAHHALHAVYRVFSFLSSFLYFDATEQRITGRSF